MACTPLAKSTPSARAALASCAGAWTVAELLLLLFRPGYPFTTRGALDSWIYASFQWNLPHQLQEFGATYYASRLSLFLPGAILHALLPTVAAVVAYKLLFSGLTVAAWAFVAQKISGWRAAGFTSGFAPLVPWFISTRHNDYMDLGVVAYGACALACLVGAWRSEHRAPLWRMTAGAALAAMLDANLSSIAMPGAGLVFVHFALTRPNLKQAARHLGDLAAGALLALSALAAVSAAAGGPVWVLGAQIDALRWVGGMSQNPWSPVDWSWLPRATWLVTPIGALAWGAARSTHNLAAHAHRLGLRALTLGLAVALGAALVLEGRGTGVLYHWFYTAFQLPIAIPLLAACATGDERAPTSSLALPLGLLTVGVIAGGDSPVFARLAASLGCSPDQLSVATGMLVLSVAVLTRGRAPSWHLETVAASLVLCAIPSGWRAQGWSDRLRERYVAIHDASALLTKEFAPNTYRFWLDPREPDGVALAATKLYGYRLLTERRFPDGAAEKPFAGVVIVPTLPGRGGSRLADARLRHPELEFAGPRVLPVRGARGVGFDLLCFRIVRRVPDPEAIGNERPDPFLELRHSAGHSYATELFQSAYGPRPRALLAADGPDVVLSPTSIRDHVATPFHVLAAGTDRTVSVVCETAAAAPGRCLVQTEDFREILSLPLAPGGRTVAQATIPDAARSLRVCFISDTLAPIALPRRVALYVMPRR